VGDAYRDPSHTKEHDMQRTAIWSPLSAAPTATSRWGAWLRHAWDELTLDADERFIRGARDPVEVEWRLRRLERGRAERFAPLDPNA
jgi:hypothetical protein